MKLSIEVDGKNHMDESGRDRDQRRDDFLQNLGYRTHRIPGYHVLKGPSEVLEKIEAFVNELLSD